MPMSDDTPMLTPEIIARLLEGSRRKNEYRHHLEAFLGRKLTPEELVVRGLETKAQQRRQRSREDRICAILVRRYGVPQTLIDALDNEHRSNYSDW